MEWYCNFFMDPEGDFSKMTDQLQNEIASSSTSCTLPCVHT